METVNQTAKTPGFAMMSLVNDVMERSCDGPIHGSRVICATIQVEIKTRNKKTIAFLAFFYLLSSVFR